MEIISSNWTRRNWSLDHLLACIRTDDSVPVDEPQYVSIVRQITDASPLVKHLVVEWYCLPDYSSAYSNLRSLHLILEHPTCKDGDPFDLDRLVQLVPGIRRLETSGRALMPDQKLVAFILGIIIRFHRVVHLVINRESRYSCSCSLLLMKNEFTMVVWLTCISEDMMKSMFGFESTSLGNKSQSLCHEREGQYVINHLVDGIEDLSGMSLFTDYLGQREWRKDHGRSSSSNS